MNKNTPLLIGLYAALVAVISLKIWNFNAFMYAVNGLGIIIVTSITFIVTVATAHVGRKLVLVHHCTKAKAASIGIILGLLAFVCISFLSLLALVHPEFDNRTFARIIYIGFFSGGFLGPVVGGITGYIVAKNINRE